MVTKWERWVLSIFVFRHIQHSRHDLESDQSIYLSNWVSGMCKKCSVWRAEWLTVGVGCADIKRWHQNFAISQSLKVDVNVLMRPALDRGCWSGLRCDLINYHTLVVSLDRRRSVKCLSRLIQDATSRSTNPLRFEGLGQGRHRTDVYFDITKNGYSHSGRHLRGVVINTHQHTLVRQLLILTCSKLSVDIDSSQSSRNFDFIQLIAYLIRAQPRYLLVPGDKEW